MYSLFFSSKKKNKPTKKPPKFFFYIPSSLMPYTSLQEFHSSMRARAVNFPVEVLKKDPELPQMFSDVYWQLKNRRIQLFPLLCLGAVEDTGGRVSLLMCSDSLLAKPTQSKVSDAGKVLFSSRAGSYPLWIKLLQSLLHKWNLRKPNWADSLKADLIFRISY